MDELPNKIGWSLGGGFVRGGFQAGAIKSVLEHGYIPQIIGGISVGTENGVYVANRVGQLIIGGGKVNDWVGEVADDLARFWLANITCPDSIATQRKALPLIWSILRKKFNGLSDTKPLRDLLNKTVRADYLIASGIELRIGLTNLADGEIHYVNEAVSNLTQYMMGSSSIPFMMPVEHIGSQPFADGGVRDSAPLKPLIEAGCTTIICIACHPEKMGAIEINTGDIKEYALRLMSIISNNNLNNDIKEAKLINALISAKQQGAQLTKELSRKIEGKRVIDLKIIRPYVPINVNINKFTTKDIQNMLQVGEITANKILQNT